MPIALVSGNILFYQSYIMSDVGQKVIRDVRDRVYDRLQTLARIFTQRGAAS
jgi:hypothetical protein